MWFASTPPRRSNRRSMRNSLRVSPELHQTIIHVVASCKLPFSGFLGCSTLHVRSTAPNSNVSHLRSARQSQRKPHSPLPHALSRCNKSACDYATGGTPSTKKKLGHVFRPWRGLASAMLHNSVSCFTSACAAAVAIALLDLCAFK